jgi:predicted nucleotidyltransferase component of viral defense system
MKYDFTPHKEMYKIAYKLLENSQLESTAALGGGTALSAYYWNHRYSTDIDIFIYEKKNILLQLRAAKWSDATLKQLQGIGYRDGNCRQHPIYVEITIDETRKIQFFETKPFGNDPYTTVNLWNTQIKVEKISEIIAKKIYYRGSLGTSRDLFDIAIAIHEDPFLLTKITISDEKLEALKIATQEIIENNSKMLIYTHDMKTMNPNTTFTLFAQHSPQYLFNYLDAFLYLKEHLVQSDFINTLKDIETKSYEKYLLNKVM